MLTTSAPRAPKEIKKNTDLVIWRWSSRPLGVLRLAWGQTLILPEPSRVNASSEAMRAALDERVRRRRG